MLVEIIAQCVKKKGGKMNRVILRGMAEDAFEEGVYTKGVLLFADVMLDKLQKARDEGKRGWYECENGRLFLHLYNEIEELKEAVKESHGRADELDCDHIVELTPEIKKELIDIANFCMMLYCNGEML